MFVHKEREGGRERERGGERERERERETETYDIQSQRLMTSNLKD